jgi:aquaporin Z
MVKRGKVKVEKKKNEGKPAADESWKKYVAELLGTFALVFFGCGSAVMANVYFNATAAANAIGLLGISFAFGITVTMMVYAIGPISGCHINPAITLAMLIAKKISIKDAGIYAVVQCIGAIAGAGVLFLVANGTHNYDISTDGLGANGYGNGYLGEFALGAAILAEIVLTFFFLLVIFGATHKKAPAGFAGIAIGFSLFVIHLVGIPITGTSVNPARSLGPAIFVGGDALNQVWVFIIAPFIGAALAAVVWKYLLEPKEDEEAPKARAEPKENAE